MQEPHPTASKTGSAPRRAWARIRPDRRFFLVALGIYLGSRLLMAAAIVYANANVPQRPGFGQVPGAWLGSLVRFDAGWYLKIASGGYVYNGDPTIEQNVAFFPLYPLLVRGVSVVTGAQDANAGLIVANVCAVGAVLLLAALARDLFDARTAWLAVALLAFFPTAFFLSAPYTESLALLLCVAFFLLLLRGRFALAALCAGAATATRSICVVLLLPLAWELWQQRRALGLPPLRLLSRAAAYSVLATAGLSLFMLYQWQAFGDPLAFVHNQEAWKAGRSAYSPFAVVTLRPVADSMHAFLFAPTNADLHGAWPWAACAALLVWRRRRLPTSVWLFAAAMVVGLYLTRGDSGLAFSSMQRFLLLAFPAFLLVADLCRRRLWLGIGLVAASAVGLFAYMSQFAQGYWVA